jgi:hypothetical protein
VRYALKTPYRDGTTHVIFEAEDFIARLAALVPKPRAHLTRYHGVFAPASPDRARVVPGTRAGAANKAREGGEASATDRRLSLTWAQRLKRVFAIDEVTRCRSELAFAAQKGRFSRLNDDRADRLSPDGNLERATPPSSAGFSTRPNGCRADVKPIPRTR